MIEFTETATVQAAVPDVAEVLRAVERWPSWNAAVSRVDRHDSGPLAVGSTATVKQPRLLPATWTVTRLDETGFTWVSDSLGVHSTGEHWAGKADGGLATVTLTLGLSGPLARVVGVLYGRLIRRYLSLEADGLRQAVEGR
jgi:hypothetical protein